MKTLKEYKGEIIIIVVVIMMIAIGFFITAVAEKEELKNYNNGICTECEGHYIFSSSTKDRHGDIEYYYTCDKCGHTIRTHQLMK